MSWNWNPDKLDRLLMQSSFSSDKARLPKGAHQGSQSQLWAKALWKAMTTANEDTSFTSTSMSASTMTAASVATSPPPPDFLSERPGNHPDRAARRPGS
eukprot:gene10046-8905_t